MQAEVGHPLGIALFRGYLAYYLGGYAAFEKVVLVFLVAEIIQRAVYIGNLCFFFHS